MANAKSKIEALKFVSDIDFWNNNLVIKYIENIVGKAKKEESFSLSDINKVIKSSKKRKQG